MNQTERDVRIARAAEVKRIRAVFAVLDDCHIDVRTSKAEIMRISARVVDAINLVDKE